MHCMVRLLEPQDCSTSDIWSSVSNGTYARPFVLDMGDRRQLHFDLNAVQSAMSLSEPERLVLTYTRKMASFLLFHSQPRRLVLLGLGGGSLAKFCYRALPDSTISVVEANRDVILLRGEFGIPDDNHRFQVIHEDGLNYIAGLTSCCDVILADACDRAGTAPRLASLDFYRAARNSLAQGGILVANVCGRKKHCSEHLSVMHEAFGGEAIVMPHKRSANIIAFCFHDPGASKRWRPSAAGANRLKLETGIDFPRYMRLLGGAGRTDESHRVSPAVADVVRV